MPKATVAAIILHPSDPSRFLLALRGTEPFKGYWSLPGGHIDDYETAASAVVREVREELGIAFDAQPVATVDEIIQEKQIHAVVQVFAGRAGTGKVQPDGAEIAETRWVRLDEIGSIELAFRHREILDDYARKHTGIAMPVVGDGSGIDPEDKLYPQEVRLALRNRGVPIEALRRPVTPAGMHYLLIHFDVADVESRDWRLEIGGRVSRGLSLNLEEIKARPKVTLAVTMECAGNGRALMKPRPISQPWSGEAVSTAEWGGTPLRGLLEETGLPDDAIEVLFTGADRGVQGGEVQAYQRSLKRGEALRDGVLLAYEMNGEPLPPQHGYPLRLVVPRWYGMTSVKWLARIDAISHEFDGYQMRSYRYRQAGGEGGIPVERQRVRALMVPPGIPDFLTRTRLLELGPVKLAGRAWSGDGRVTRVEVSWDGGARWHEARLEPPVGEHAWLGWSIEWDAAPGRYTLMARATDESGDIQPIEPPWNFQGMGNNAVQRVAVMVR